MNPQRAYKDAGENLYSLFDTCHDDTEDNHYLSEDYTFCKDGLISEAKYGSTQEISLSHYGRLGFSPDTSELKKMCEAFSSP